MCSKKWLEITFITETIGFFMSVTSHSFLLFLIGKSDKRKFGSYKYLMICFSALGIFYSSCNFWCKPNVHITETTFVIFTVLEHWKMSKFYGTVSISIYSSCFAMILCLLTVQFYYRFISVTTPLTLTEKFSWRTAPRYLILVLGFSTVWGSLTFFVNGPSDLKDIELNPEFQKVYCLDSTDFAYIAAKYFYTNSQNASERIIHWPSIIVISVMTPMMSATFSCLLFFGIKTYSSLNKTRLSSASKKDMQHQLFRTLVIQTCIPTIFMYLPVSCLFYFPLFGFTVPELQNLIPIFVSIYPCLEPLVAMYFIRHFRSKIYGKNIRIHLWTDMFQVS
ncbi:hypothetical protein CRE_13042 [Caenorhabditis remanei]|uniref:Serpentine receptor class r-10 n=1 Tax=Caenorhabditis remanei TaxID=31234 RepID=E3N7F9_CAERE|nr:hypothetical protein CRE_13042 [Caenorhabditis remanei]